VRPLGQVRICVELPGALEIGGESSIVAPGVVLVIDPGVVVLRPGVVVLSPGVVVLSPGVVVLRLGAVVVGVPKLGVVDPGSGGKLLFGTTGRPKPVLPLLALLPVPAPMPLVVAWPSAALEAAAKATISRVIAACMMKSPLG
jgi:hypothetical protein